MYLIHVKHSDCHNLSFQLTGGNIITADEYHDQTFVFIFCSAEIFHYISVFQSRSHNDSTDIQISRG